MRPLPAIIAAVFLAGRASTPSIDTTRVVDNKYNTIRYASTPQQSEFVGTSANASGVKKRSPVGTCTGAPPAIWRDSRCSPSPGMAVHPRVPVIELRIEAVCASTLSDRWRVDYVLATGDGTRPASVAPFALAEWRRSSHSFTSA
jgi:hypothetical protein